MKNPVSRLHTTRGMPEPPVDPGRFTPQDRLGLVTSALERTQRDLKTVADDVAQLRQVAADLEQQARDNQALSQLSSEQLDAFRRDLARRDRNSLYQQLILFAAGLVAGYLLNQLG
jgi:hypothetical protein